MVFDNTDTYISWYLITQTRLVSWDLTFPKSQTPNPKRTPKLPNPNPSITTLGEIDREELGAALLKLNMRVRDMELDNLFEICDPDESGSIDIQEFSSWYEI